MADVAEIFNRPNPVVIGGDFNGHHGMWESNAPANTAGKTIFETILNSQDICLITPTDLGLNGANEKCFKKSKPSRARNSEPSRPWWNAECNTLVKNARTALKNWCKSPTSLHLRTEWKKAEALKKRHIIKAKKEAWSSFISNLGPQDQPRLWTFTKSMLGKGSNLSPDGPLISNNNTTINSPKEKADLFLDRFSSVYPANLPTNDHFYATINSNITSTTHNILNDPITPEELERSLPKSKSKAVGADLVNMPCSTTCHRITGPTTPIQHPIYEIPCPSTVEGINRATPPKTRQESRGPFIVPPNLTHFMPLQDHGKSNRKPPTLVPRVQEQNQQGTGRVQKGMQHY
ncbi:hypothetical protein DAPPUDRAFT_268353 [Daphnia pulex]|uniref:Endonuclease/exonuclease/phosphatase domain-containing protein n=1 Tax=Daphnia pulex TaxID=6669 RepID=E9HXP7_DAPPU|nr:hypothetical protein DAPPUDRAFT_268353 [Daphnia pulex]|eukprot:EFX63481.1 hypothetical protein DAPPUDRAFT_268353 [Daphnia pulex]